MKIGSGGERNEEDQEGDNGKHSSGVGDSWTTQSVAFGEIEEAEVRKETESNDMEYCAEGESEEGNGEEGGHIR